MGNRYTNRSELVLAHQRREITDEQFGSLSALFDEQESSSANAEPTNTTAKKRDRYEPEVTGVDRGVLHTRVVID